MESCPLIDLPVEIQSVIIEYMLATTSGWDAPSSGSVLSLSSSCTFYRSLLRAHVFRTVILSNAIKSGERVLALSRSPLSPLAREFYFKGACDDAMSEERWQDTAVIFPPTVSIILSDLRSHFPNLEKVRVNFSYGSGSSSYSAYSVLNREGAYEREESREHMLFYEERDSWRCLMALAFAALAANIDPTFKTLVIEYLVLKEISVFFSDEWHCLLSKMESFELSLDVKCVEGKWPTIQSIWLPRLSRYREYLLAGLENLTDLSLKQNLLGIVGIADTHLRMLPTQMRKLRRFRLEDSYIGSGLIDFLLRYHDQLEVVHLKNCSIYWESGPNKGQVPAIHWSTMFTELAKADFAQLRSFIIEPRDLPTANVELFRDLRGLVRLIDMEMQTRPRARFGYVRMDFDQDYYDQYGSRYPVIQCSIEDQEAYEKFMEHIKKKQRNIGML